MRKSKSEGAASLVAARIPSRETQLRQQVVGALLGGSVPPAQALKATCTAAIEAPLRAVEVCAVMGWSLATLRRRMREGEFPEPAFGRGGARRRILLWRVSDIRAFIENGGVVKKRESAPGKSQTKRAKQ